MDRHTTDRRSSRGVFVNAAPRPRLWTTDYTLTLLGTFTFFGSFFYLLSVLPEYVDDIGGEKWHIGLIVGGFNLIPLFLRPFAGRWSDRGARLRLMRVSLVIFAIALLLMVWSEDIWSLLVLRIVQGVGMAMFPTAAGSLVAELAPMTRRGEGVGFFGMSTSLAQMIFPALGVIVADTWGFDAIFVVASVTAALTLLTVARIQEPPMLPAKPRSVRLAELPAAISALRPRGLPAGLPAAQKGASPKPTTPDRPGSLIPHPAIFPMSIFLTVTFSFGAASAFLPLLSAERGLGNVGLYFLASGAGAVVTRPIAGGLSDRLGRVSVVVPGLILSAVGMWILTQADGLPIMLLAGVFGGVGLGAAHTGLLALALDRVRGNQRGGATAIFQIAWDIGGLLGSTVLGFVATAIDVEIVFWIASVVIFSGVVALLGGRTVGWTTPHPESVAEPLASTAADI